MNLLPYLTMAYLLGQTPTTNSPLRDLIASVKGHSETLVKDSIFGEGKEYLFIKRYGKRQVLISYIDNNPEGISPSDTLILLDNEQNVRTVRFQEVGLDYYPTVVCQATYASKGSNELVDITTTEEDFQYSPCHPRQKKEEKEEHRKTATKKLEAIVHEFIKLLANNGGVSK